jgi:hypothetical protein
MVLAQRLESGGRKLSPEDSDSGDKASRVRRTHSMTTSCKLRETRSSSSLSGPVVHVDNHSSDPQGGLRFLVAKRRTREKKPAAQDMTTTARLVPSSSSAKRVHMCALHLSSSRARSCLHRVDIPSRQMKLTSRPGRQIPPLIRRCSREEEGLKTSSIADVIDSTPDRR